jgi:glycosyltransferase involved in cell wall biosynthesis
VAKYGERVRTRRTLYGPPSAFAAASGPAGPPPGLAQISPAEAPLVVSVSRHQPRKGIDVLLRALGALRDRGVPFRACLAGDGELLEENRALAFRLGLASSVLVAGALPSVTGLLSKGDLFVLPSRREQSGSLALLEALQAGIPAVASACDGIPEDVVHGESAWLVPPGDAGALADAIADLLADEGQRERLSRGGREAFAKRFSAEAFSRDLACAYAELGFIP